jgi:hypothetical protein
MGLVAVLWLWLACTAACPGDEVRAPAAKASRPAMPPPKGTLDRPPRVPAPAREVWGLTLGGSDHAAVISWLEARQVPCRGVPAPRRKTVHYRCNEVPGALFAERTLDEGVSVLLLARPDDGPLHHISALRRYATPLPAIADYTTAVAALRAGLGVPSDADADAPRPAAFDAKAVRFSTRWLFSDLEVEIGLYRLAGPDIVVRERWDVPGVEAGVGARGGGGVHGRGGGPHSPHGIVVPTGAESVPGFDADADRN